MHVAIFDVFPSVSSEENLKSETFDNRTHMITNIIINIYTYVCTTRRMETEESNSRTKTTRGDYIVERGTTLRNDFAVKTHSIHI